jgi:hypothetical protein
MFPPGQDAVLSCAGSLIPHYQAAFTVARKALDGCVPLVVSNIEGELTDQRADYPIFKDSPYRSHASRPSSRNTTSALHEHHRLESIEL